MLKTGIFATVLLLFLIGGALHFVFSSSTPNLDVVAIHDKASNDGIKAENQPTPLTEIGESPTSISPELAKLHEQVANIANNELAGTSDSNHEVDPVEELANQQDEYLRLLDEADLMGELLPSPEELDNPDAYAAFEARQHELMIQEFHKEALLRIEEIDQFISEGQSMGMSEEELMKAEERKEEIRSAINSIDFGEI